MQHAAGATASPCESPTATARSIGACWLSGLTASMRCPKPRSGPRRRSHYCRRAGMPTRALSLRYRFRLPPVHPASACLSAYLPACLLAVVGSSQLLLPRQKVKSNIASHASAHLQAHLRHLPHSSAPAQDHSCPPSTFISCRRRRRSPPTTSSIGSPALTCCARLDHSSTSRLSSYYYASRPTRRLSSVTQQPSLPLTFCIFL